MLWWGDPHHLLSHLQTPTKENQRSPQCTCHTAGLRAPLAEVQHTQQHLTHHVLDNKCNSMAEQAMSLEAVFGDSNASKGIVICHSLHWYRYTGKTGQHWAAQHLIGAQQSLNTLLEQHGLQGLPAMGSCEFSDNFFLGMTHESYDSMRRQGSIFEIPMMFSSCFEYRVLLF